MELEPALLMRADARRNRERLLCAAIELILEVGGEPTREALSAHAGVGIGTVYRHFPDQQSLLNAVVRYALERSIAAGEAALADSGDAFDAIRKYMHAALDNGIGVVNLIYPLLDRPHRDLRVRAESLIHSMIEGGKNVGRLRSDASPADVVFATIRFGRPLAVGLSAADERAIAHRELDIYVDGLSVREQATNSRASCGRGSRSRAAGAISSPDSSGSATHTISGAARKTRGRER